MIIYMQAVGRSSKGRSQSKASGGLNIVQLNVQVFFNLFPFITPWLNFEKGEWGPLDFPCCLLLP